MTPLAQEMLRFSMDSGTNDPDGIALKLPQCSFFEVSDVMDDIYDLAAALYKRPLINTIIANLPFPIMWIEHLSADGGRDGILLEAAYEDGFELVRTKRAWSYAPPDQRISTDACVTYRNSDGSVALPSYDGVDEKNDLASALFLRAAVILINTHCRLDKIYEPPPVRGFRRAFRRSDHPLAHQELPGWHRIRLAKPLEHPSSGKLIERGSGVALHRVRGHARVLPDRVTWVNAHKRGDAAYGIRRSFYDVDAA